MKQKEAVIGLALAEFLCVLYIVCKITGHFLDIYYFWIAGIAIFAASFILSFIALVRGGIKGWIFGVIMGILGIGLASLFLVCIPDNI